MSYPYDADRDDPREVRTVETDCVECGTRGRFPASHGKCPACIELGQAPPPCPQCETRTLHGFQLHETMAWTWECSECAARFSMRQVRTYALGLAVERIVRERSTESVNNPRNGAERLEIGGLVLRAARELKVI